MQNIGREVRREEEKTKDSANRREKYRVVRRCKYNYRRQFRRYNTRLRPARQSITGGFFSSDPGCAWVFGCKKIAAPQFHALSPTALLGVALSGLTNVDRTGNSIFHLIWPQPKVSFAAAWYAAAGAAVCDYIHDSGSGGAGSARTERGGGVAGIYSCGGIGVLQGACMRDLKIPQIKCRKKFLIPQNLTYKGGPPRIFYKFFLSVSQPKSVSLSIELWKFFTMRWGENFSRCDEVKIFHDEVWKFLWKFFTRDIRGDPWI